MTRQLSRPQTLPSTHAGPAAPPLPAGAINDDGRGLRSDGRTREREREGRLFITLFSRLSRHLTFACNCSCGATQRSLLASPRFFPLRRLLRKRLYLYISFLFCFFLFYKSYTPFSEAHFLVFIACRYLPRRRLLCPPSQRRRLNSKRLFQTDCGFYWSII